MFPLNQDQFETAPVNPSTSPICHSHSSKAKPSRTLSMMLMRVVLPVLIALAMVLPASAQTGADLNISPKRVVFGPGERAATVYIFNQGDTEATYTVEMVDRVMRPDGQIVAAADHPDEVVSSALDLVQHTPRRITLRPRESQAIRVRARPGSGGEHRTHLTVTALPAETAGFTAEQAAREGADELSVQVVALFSISIPVIVRDEVADARAAVENLTLVRGEDMQGVALDLVRLGGNSVYGDIEVREGARADGPLLTAVRGVAVYPEIDRRAAVVALPRALAPGETVTVIYRDDDARPGEILASATLIAP